jgi:uncharacterized membrane protein
MAVAGGVVPRLRERLASVTEHRHALRRRLARLERDALVATLLVGLAAVVVVVAAYTLAVAVSNGGIAGLVLGWTAAFAFAVSLPVLAMRVASAVYVRVGG